eukprot:364453-Chlamydomonas_euryale.AAC.5
MAKQVNPLGCQECSIKPHTQTWWQGCKRQICNRAPHSALSSRRSQQSTTLGTLLLPCGDGDQQMSEVGGSHPKNGTKNPSGCAFWPYVIQAPNPAQSMPGCRPHLCCCGQLQNAA